MVTQSFLTCVAIHIYNIETDNNNNKNKRYENEQDCDVCGCCRNVGVLR